MTFTALGYLIPWVAGAQRPQPDNDSRYYGSRVEDATPLVGEGQDDTPAALRQARARFFNGGLAATPLVQRPDGPPGILHWEPGRQEPLHFTKDGIAVLGQATGRHCHLSEDGAGIYTEYDFKVEEIVLAPKTTNVSAVSTITIVEYGGAVRLPTGRVLRFEAHPNMHLRPDERYLLFATLWPPKTEAFFPLKLWGIKDGLVVRGAPSSGGGFLGLNDAAFLWAVRAEAAEARKRFAIEDPQGNK